MDYSATASSADRSGQALIKACSAGDEETVRQMLQAGADPRVAVLPPQQHLGLQTPLLAACMWAHCNIARMLLDAGADPAFPKGSAGLYTDQPLHAACRYSAEPKLVKVLLDAGAEPDDEVMEIWPSRERPLNYRGDRALHLAARLEGGGEVCRLLLEAGASVDALGSCSATPLLVACDAGLQVGLEGIHVFDETLEVLLAAGASANACMPHTRQTALHMVVNPQIAAKLLAAHAYVNACDAEGRTPLHMAVMRNARAMVPVLLAGRANVEAVDNTTRRPLDYAARNGDPQTVAALLAAGASVDTRHNSASGRNWTPLHAACSANHGQVVQLLVDAGASLDIMDDDGGRPLHEAAWRGAESAVRALLEAGADPNLEDGYEHVPGDHAVSRGHIGVVRMLVMAGAGDGPVGPSDIHVMLARAWEAERQAWQREREAWQEEKAIYEARLEEPRQLFLAIALEAKREGTSCFS